MGEFVSPFLVEMLSLITAESASHRTTKLEGLGRQIVTSVPSRLLLPAVDETARIEEKVCKGKKIDSFSNSLLRLQRLAAMQVWMFAKISPEYVTSAETLCVESLQR